MKQYILVFLLITGLSSCYYDSEESLYPSGECITTNMSYTADIAPIINTSCISCHSAAANLGNINLEGYNAIIKHVQNGKLLGSIRHDNGFSAMPQGARKLNTCKISQVEAWINQGSPNN